MCRSDPVAVLLVGSFHPLGESEPKQAKRVGVVGRGGVAHCNFVHCKQHLAKKALIAPWQGCGAYSA